MRGVSTRHNLRGAVGVWLAATVSLFLCMSVLALGAGYLYSSNADLQNAADASALAAAITLIDLNGLNPEAAYDTALRVAARSMDISPSDAARMMDFTVGRYNDPLDHTPGFVATIDDSSNAVHVVLHPMKARGHSVRLFSAAILGKRESDFSALAVSGRAFLRRATLVPIALRDPESSPFDPDVEENSPGKNGPSFSDSDGFFVLEKEGTVYAFGEGPRPAVYLTLEAEELRGPVGANDLPAIDVATTRAKPWWVGLVRDPASARPRLERRDRPGVLTVLP